jgi:DNA-binding LytR/AlgR family response regulator
LLLRDEEFVALLDAIFCDINMPDLNGMEFVKSLAVPPLVVFTTAYSEYAVEGFKVNKD